MITYEPKCVALKRRGAEYVSQMLSGKSKQEELEFWSKRTERLRASHNKALEPTPKAIHDSKKL